MNIVGAGRGGAARQRKRAGAGRSATAAVAAITAVSAIAGLAAVGLDAVAGPVASAAPRVGDAASVGGTGLGAAGAGIGVPTIPYEPPTIDGDGGVRSPVIPAAVWGRAEYGIGRVTGKNVGMSALDRLECTPVTAIHVPGSGETNEQRDPDVPHGRIMSGLGHDLSAEFGGEVRNLYVPYVSDAFLTSSYESSAAAGADAFGELVDTVSAQCPDTAFVFTGYSQGSDVIGSWVARALAGRAGGFHRPRHRGRAVRQSPPRCRRRRRPRHGPRRFARHPRSPRGNLGAAGGPRLRLVPRRRPVVRRHSGHGTHRVGGHDRVVQPRGRRGHPRGHRKGGRVRGTGRPGDP